MPGDIVIRRAEKRDLPEIGRLGAALIRVHREFDSQRFMSPGDDPEGGYAWFLGTQLRKRDVAVFVAQRDGEVIGYAYCGIEPRSWMELRDEAGFIHDIVVAERARRVGIGRRLLATATEWLFSRGVPRVMLWTAERNDAAQQLFASAGFRRTMIEMTRERD
jgi:ribosomal protein S18 acetylase RimI-like enzyme